MLRGGYSCARDREGPWGNDVDEVTHGWVHKLLHGTCVRWLKLAIAKATQSGGHKVILGVKRHNLSVKLTVVVLRGEGVTLAGKHVRSGLLGILHLRHGCGRQSVPHRVLSIEIAPRTGRDIIFLNQVDNILVTYRLEEEGSVKLINFCI